MVSRLACIPKRTNGLHVCTSRVEGANQVVRVSLSCPLTSQVSEGASRGGCTDTLPDRGGFSVCTDASVALVRPPVHLVGSLRFRESCCSSRSERQVKLFAEASGVHAAASTVGLLLSPRDEGGCRYTPSGSEWRRPRVYTEGHGEAHYNGTTDR